MASKFIGFKPLSGVFEETMEPYKEMTEKAEMSILLEVEGNYYRILRTTIDGLTLRKMIVCHEDGQIEKSEEVTRECFQFYVYLSFYVFNQKRLSFDTTQAGKSQHEPLIQNFQTMVSDLTPILSTVEKEAMEFHLYYLQEIYRLSILIADSAKEVLTYGKQLEELKENDTLSSTKMSEINEKIEQRNLLKGQLEGVLLEDGERARTIVKSVLKNRDYRKQMSNRFARHKILKEMKGATKASERYIERFKNGYKNLEMDLEIDTGPFSVKKLIDELYSGIYKKQIMQGNIEGMIREDWILSADYQYK